VFLATFFKTWRGKQLLSYSPTIVKNAMARIISRSIAREGMLDEAAVEFLRSALQERTAELSELLNRNFVEWKPLSVHDEPVSAIAS
jgi:hypothetical protein